MTNAIHLHLTAQLPAGPWHVAREGDHYHVMAGSTALALCTNEVVADVISKVPDLIRAANQEPSTIEPERDDISHVVSHLENDNRALIKKVDKLITTVKAAEKALGELTPTQTKRLPKLSALYAKLEAALRSL